ncbi:MAG: dihydroorotase family protein [Candidatus Methanomethylophilaceae archaeon]|nr:dihydroorotase family protein [Candidatus Methanomethylophilaceae archaeon]
MELVVEGRYYRHGELRQGCIGIEEGRIVALDRILKGEMHIDLGSRIILPGSIDPHVHFRDPGMTEKEDFLSGSTAALYAGVTTVLDMPNTKPPVKDREGLMDKKRVIRGRSFVDYGLFAALTPGCDIPSMAAEVAGFKLFMGSTTGKILVDDDREIARLLPQVFNAGKVVSVHAEDESMMGSNVERDPMDHLRNRPLEGELNAIRRLSPFRGQDVNICHVSSAQSMEMAHSLGFSTEVTAHHLFLHAGMVLGPRGKVNPPLREKKAQEDLLDAFMDGKADMIGSDHAPHTLTDKEQEFHSCPSGIPGVGTTVPMLMAMVKRGHLSLGELVRMACENPAKRFGLKKGVIEVGYDADLVSFDGRRMREVDAKRLPGKSGWTPFQGREALFADTIILGGELQLRKGELCGEPVGRDVFHA